MDLDVFRYLRLTKVLTSYAPLQANQCLCSSLCYSILATVAFPIFYPASVAEETGLSLALSETMETGFVASNPNPNYRPSQNTQNTHPTGGNRNALNNRRTRIENCYKQCFRLPFVASQVTNGKRKLCF